MTISEDAYRPPVDEAPLDHSTFSPEEWRYMGRVFALWVVWASVGAGVFLTVRTVYALKAFNAAFRTGGIVVVSALRQMAPLVVIFAACNTLVLIVERRSKKQVPVPADIWRWWVFVSLYAALPIANVLIVATSFVMNTLAYDRPTAEFWEDMRSLVAFKDIPLGIILLSSLIALFAIAAPALMRRLSRYQGWLPLKYFILWQICSSVSISIGGVLGGIQGLFR